MLNGLHIAFDDEQHGRRLGWIQQQQLINNT